MDASFGIAMLYYADFELITTKTIVVILHENKCCIH